MVFKKLHIENFRSINPDGITLEFINDNNIVSLVGPNNVGKSNILTALGLVLGASKFYNFEWDENDFFDLDVTKTILISLEFSEPIIHFDIYQKLEIHSIKIEVESKSRRPQKGEINATHYCYNNKNEIIMAARKVYKKKKDEEDKSPPKLPLRWKEISGKFIPVYYLDNSNPGYFYRTSGLHPLGRLMRVYKDDFRNVDNLYTFTRPDGTKSQMSNIDAFHKAAARLNTTLETETLKRIQDNLIKSFAKLIGLDNINNVSLNLSVQSPEDLFDKLIELKLKEQGLVNSIPLSNHGDGFLSIFRIATYEALGLEREITNALYIIDEPESFLHPHLRRYFYKVMENLASPPNGNHFIFATHSNEFLSLNNYREVVRVVKKEDQATKTIQLISATKINFTRLETEIKTKGNQEIFFSNYVFICEGKDDLELQKLLWNKCFPQVDIDSHSISFLQIGGKQNLKKYSFLSNKLEIPCFVLFDEDILPQSEIDNISDPELKVKANQKNDYNKKINPELEKFLGDLNIPYFIYPIDLEHTIKTTKARSNIEGLLELIDSLSIEQIDTDFPDLLKPIKKFHQSFFNDIQS